jgi:hypothetical protein
VVVRREDIVFVYIGDGNWHWFDLAALEDAATNQALNKEIALARRARG